MMNWSFWRDFLIGIAAVIVIPIAAVAAFGQWVRKEIIWKQDIE